MVTHDVPDLAASQASAHVVNYGWRFDSQTAFQLYTVSQKKFPPLNSL